VALSVVRVGIRVSIIGDIIRVNAGVTVNISILITYLDPLILLYQSYLDPLILLYLSYLSTIDDNRL